MKRGARAVKSDVKHGATLVRCGVRHGAECTCGPTHPQNNNSSNFISNERPTGAESVGLLFFSVTKPAGIESGLPQQLRQLATLAAIRRI